MMKIIYNCSRAIQKSKKILTQMRNNKFYMDDPRMSQRKEAQQIVEQLYFYKEDKLSRQIKEEETHFSKMLEKPQDQVNFRKFSTVKEMLDFYDSKQFNFTRQQYTDFFLSLRHCIKNAEKIQQNKLNYHKKLAAKYRVKYNKEYEPPIYVFLTVDQILKEPVFNTLLEDFVRECEVNDFLVVRKALMDYFQQKTYILDYFILQRLWEVSEYQIETIYLLSYLIKDIANGKLPPDVQEQFLALFEGRHRADQNLQQVLEQFLLEKLSNIQFQELDNQKLTDFIYAYNWNRTLEALPSFQTELVVVLKERVATFTVSQTLKILKILIVLRVGDDQIFNYLMWNIIRLKSQIKSNVEFGNLIFILYKFEQNKLFIQDRRISQEYINVKDFMVFPELFQVAMENLNRLVFSQLAKLLKTAYYNYAEPSQTNAIITTLFKQNEIKEQYQIDDKIELFYIATQIGNMELDVNQLLKQKIMLLTKNTVVGFFEVMKTKTKSEIHSEQPYYTKELHNLIKLTWTCIVQKCQNFEDINYLILKINELTSFQTIMKVEKKLHKLISQINQYISLFGKNNFPEKINFEQINKNPSIISFREKYAHPKRVSTFLFAQEVYYFSGKYKSDLEKNITYKDMFIDIVYTNPKTGNKAFIIFNGPNDYTMSVTGEMIPHNQIAFQEELLQTSKIPVVRINLPDLVRSKKTCYFEEVLKDILEGGNEEYEDHFKLVQKYREELKNNFNYISTFEDSVDEEEEVQEVAQQDDHYELSDEEK